MARATVREIECKSALNRVQGMPFKWSLNPYRGCAHGCHYCYARATHAYFNLNAGDDFSNLLFAKVNFAGVLRAELSAPSWRRELVSLGSATDPYQPIEGSYRLSRKSLEALCDFRTPVSVITKSTLVWRDVDVLQQMGRRAMVGVSIPTVDEDAWRLTEPGTPSPEQRLRIVERLAAAGVHAGVLVAPLLPGITADEAHVEAAIRAAAEHGARFLWTGLLHLDRGVREHYLGFIRERYPELLKGYLQLYTGKYAPPHYADRVGERAERYRATWGLGARYVEAPEARQLSLL